MKNIVITVTDVDDDFSERLCHILREFCRVKSTESGVFLQFPFDKQSPLQQELIGTAMSLHLKAEVRNMPKDKQLAINLSMLLMAAEIQIKRRGGI